MKNTPNMFRVHYLVMEGNNYAGGWGRRFKDVEQLGDIINISNIQEVVPIYIEAFDSLTKAECDQAVAERKEANEVESKQRAVQRAQDQLARANAM